MRSSWNPDHVPAPLTQDGLHDWADDLMAKGLFQVMDAQLDGLESEKLSTDILTCILTVTLPVKRKLPSRRRIFVAAKSRLGPDMLKGLEE
jgi:hypothetical protein